VDPEGRQLGIKPLFEALQIAQQQDLDLVEVAPLANPPVCRIMDYGKFKFDEAQRAKESRRRANNFGIKEMKYRPKIGNGDFDTKTRQVVKFLHEGHKVKVTVMFRGREVFHSELGKKILDRIAEQVDGMARIESEARLDGKNMVMVLAPDRRALQATAAKAQNQAVSAQPGAVPAGAHAAEAPAAEAPAEAADAPAAEAPAEAADAPAAEALATSAEAAAPAAEAAAPAATEPPATEAPAAKPPVLEEPAARTPPPAVPDAVSADAGSSAESNGADAATETKATKG
jgi:translation initiation factor IF-3